ncbi:N-acetylated-alpha-linked acidic dipeptidase [Sarotherodon galilaeus]
MMEQGDGAQAQPNEGQPHETAEDGDGVEGYNFIENPVYPFIAIIPRFYAAARPLQLHNNNNGDHIDLDNFFNVHFEIDDNNPDDGNDDSNADDENGYNNRDIEHDHNYGNYNFADDNQNADSSNDEEEHNEGHQDENALAAAEADYVVNPDAGEAEEDLLPGGFRRRFREEDSEDEISPASKHFRWWNDSVSGEAVDTRTNGLTDSGVGQQQKQSLWRQVYC